MKNKTIAVIGHRGIVGKATFEYYNNSAKFNAMGLSVRYMTHTWPEINKYADYIFLAVPTPFDWKTNKPSTKTIEDVLSRIKGDKKVIIKSTVLPGTTEELQKKYPDLYLFFNPEFLSVATAKEDFINPDRQLVGYTKKSYKHATEVLHILPTSPCDLLMTSTEAEIAKYVNNFHGALMVIFANMFYDISEKTKSDFSKIKKAGVASKWVGSPMGRMYWNIWHKRYRGYGSGCFPKDMNSLIYWCHKNKVPCQILEAARERNIELLKESGINSEREAERR